MWKSWILANLQKKPIILFNLKIDTQRGDLGPTGVPTQGPPVAVSIKSESGLFLTDKAVHAFSFPEPPFVVNYQGAIFRQYPGPFQCLLGHGQSAFRPVSTSARRPALGEFKETITMALKIGAKSPSNEGKNRKFVRHGRQGDRRGGRRTRRASRRHTGGGSASRAGVLLRPGPLTPG